MDQPKRRPGFSTGQLLVVLGLLAALAATGVIQQLRPDARRVAKEHALRANLEVMRRLIDRYHSEHGSYPEGLAALVSARYLRDIPVDPVTERKDSWQVVCAEANPCLGPGHCLVTDVRSGASGADRDGVPFAQY